MQLRFLLSNFHTLTKKAEKYKKKNMYALLSCLIMLSSELVADADPPPCQYVHW